MAIMNTTKSITVQTINGQIYVSPDFKIEQNIPFHGIVRITDNEDGRIFWINFDNFVWAGPRV